MRKELIYILGQEVLQTRMRFMAEGFEVRFFSEVQALLDEVGAMQPDLILHTGYCASNQSKEFCMRLREKTDKVIILQGEGLADFDIVTALSLGADVYLNRSTSTSVLVAQVQACFRRAKLSTAAEERRTMAEYLIDWPELKINLKSRMVTVDSHAVALTMLEFNILALLASHPNQVFYTNQIFQSVWDVDSILSGDDRPVSVHISRLRKKIEKDPVHPRFIITVRGVGYKFQPAD